jgi:phospholipase A1
VVFRLLVVVGALWLAAGAAAAQRCVEIEDDVERLACYDREAGRPVRPEAPTAIPAPAAASAPSVDERRIRAERLGQSLSERWELAPAPDLGTFLPRPYKPVYALPFTYGDRVNRAPASPAPDHTSAEVSDLDALEFKYQVSVKTKLARGLLAGEGDLWLGYTQSSRWQVYNGPLSRPFRETNYEPELIVVWPVDTSLFGWRARMVAIALNHQSNGRALPLSRSWNRIVAEAAFDRDDWSLSLRPWWRVKEPAETDDNPDIQNYVGRAEMLLTRRWRDHVLTLQLRHSLRLGTASRGSAQVDWAFPVVGNLKGYLQWFSGYGESLVDYNFRQTKLGIGASIVEWE